MPKHTSTILRQANVITEARYDMSALEKNIVYMLMAQVKQGDEPEKSYVVSLSELQGKTGDFSVKELRKATTNLLSRSYRIKEEKGNLLIVGLMGLVHYDAPAEVLRIKISRNIIPYFIALKKNYTEFQLDMALRMRSKYSKRIYEMLSQHKGERHWGITVRELKERLDLIKKDGEEVYAEWPAFKNQVLEIAKREISQHTNILFTYKALKTGKRYTNILFNTQEKPKQLNIFNRR